MTKLDYIKSDELKQYYGEKNTAIPSLGGGSYPNPHFAYERTYVKVTESVGDKFKIVCPYHGVLPKEREIIVPAELVHQEVAPLASSMDWYKEVLDRKFPNRWFVLNIPGGLVELYLHYPVITIRNSMGQVHTVTDLLVALLFETNRGKMRLHEQTPRGSRLSMSENERRAAYLHSHLKSGAYGFEHFCIGGGSNFANFMQSYTAADALITPDAFDVMLDQIETYLSWESIEGVPYTYIKNIDSIQIQPVIARNGTLTDTPIYTYMERGLVDAASFRVARTAVEMLLTDTRWEPLLYKPRKGLVFLASGSSELLELSLEFEKVLVDKVHKETVPSRLRLQLFPYSEEMGGYVVNNNGNTSDQSRTIAQIKNAITNFPVNRGASPGEIERFYKFLDGLVPNWPVVRPLVQEGPAISTVDMLGTLDRSSLYAAINALLYYLSTKETLNESDNGSTPSESADNSTVSSTNISVA